MIIKLFIKIFLFKTIFFNLIIFNASAEIINKFKIDGNERIPNETIIMFSGINIGDDISKTNLNEVLKRIYESNFFEDVKVSLSENILSINVKESPLIENVEIKGPKAKKLSKL